LGEGGREGGRVGGRAGGREGRREGGRVSGLRLAASRVVCSWRALHALRLSHLAFFSGVL
jgi:hypothetical protein